MMILIYLFRVYFESEFISQGFKFLTSFFLYYYKLKLYLLQNYFMYCCYVYTIIFSLISFIFFEAKISVRKIRSIFLCFFILIFFLCLFICFAFTLLFFFSNIIIIFTGTSFIFFILTNMLINTD